MEGIKTKHVPQEILFWVIKQYTTNLQDLKSCGNVLLPQQIQTLNQ